MVSIDPQPVISVFHNKYLLRHIFSFIGLEETARARIVSHLFHKTLPRARIFRALDTQDSHSTDELVVHFELPPISAPVTRMQISASWEDQGWGNRKGRIILRRVRNGVPVAVKDLFGVAEHFRVKKLVVLAGEEMVDRSQAGDTFVFLRLVGGGGGHVLFLSDFRVVLESFE